MAFCLKFSLVLNYIFKFFLRHTGNNVLDFLSITIAVIAYFIFIKNIKKLLNAPLTTKNESRQIQSIISTHSSHIVSESEFSEIKYMRRAGNEVTAKNLKDLQKEYDNDEQQWYTFLKHYLTLSRSELFFADKAITIAHFNSKN